MYSFILFHLISQIFNVEHVLILLDSIPPLSLVGLSEEQALEKATGDILVFTSTFNSMKNTISG